MGAEAGLVFFVVVVAVAFYWILLRPVMIQQRRQRSDIRNLQVGDEVLTQAGFIARVKDIRVPPDGPAEIVLELGPGVEVRAYATAIVQRLSPKPGAAPEANPPLAEAPSGEGEPKQKAKGRPWGVVHPVTPSEAKGLEEVGLPLLHPRFFVRLRRAQNDRPRGALYATGWLR